MLADSEAVIKELCERFDLVTQEQLAALLGVKVKTLQCRPDSALPEYVKRSRRRLFKGASVREYLGVA